MAVGDTTRMVFWTDLSVQVGLIVRHYRHSAVAGTGLNHQQIADAMFATASIPFPALLTTASRFHSITAQKVEPLPASLAFRSSAAPLPGTGGATPLPPQVSGIITLRSNIAGRRNRGRSYIPFPSEERNDNGVPNATYMTSLVTFADLLDDTLTFTVGINSETLVPCIFRRNFTPRTIDVTSAVARAVWATQRRRGAYGATNIIL